MVCLVGEFPDGHAQSLSLGARTSELFSGEGGLGGFGCGPGSFGLLKELWAMKPHTAYRDIFESSRAPGPEIRRIKVARNVEGARELWGKRGGELKVCMKF